jgi:hypothetical protein
VEAVAALLPPQLEERHPGREEGEHPDQRHHEREALGEHRAGFGLPPRGLPRLDGAPRHESPSDGEEGRPQEKTPARDPHGRLLSQPVVPV